MTSAPAGSDKIGDLLAAGRTLSFEFFPPKSDEAERQLEKTIHELAPLRPSFVSVTHGAGGSTRDRTHEVVARVQNELHITAMAHLTCVGSRRDEIHVGVEKLIEAGIENVLALRGDPPKDQETFVAVEGGFGHATDLISYLRHHFPRHSLGAACYPEDHPESPNRLDDLNWTLEKEKAGAGFFVTQLFFDNRFYFDAVARAREAGMSAPIVPGIMPVTNVAQIERFTKMCGASIPSELRERLTSCGDDPAKVMATGIEQGIRQCRELLERGAPGLHFYTLNKSHATRSVLAAVRSL
jgi:methylenetetrahydrofolate reductase (NADPH)